MRTDASPARGDGVSSPFRRRRRILVACSTLFLLALVGSAAQGILRSRQEARLNAERQVDTLARVLAEQTRAALMPVEVVVRQIAQAHAMGKLPPAGSREMFEYLRRQRGLLSATGNIVIASATGERLADAESWPGPGGSIARRKSFAVLSQRPGPETFTDTVTPSENATRWIVPIAARLEGPGGAFDGIVTSAINAEYFQTFYASAALRPGMAVILLHDDGTMVARYPAMPGLVGRSAPEYRQLVASTHRGTGPARPVDFLSAVDKTRRYGVTRPVPGQPFHVSVTEDASVALDAWREQAIGTVIRTALLVAVAAALLVAVLRQLTRLEAARAGLKASEERFALAVAGANDGIWDWDLAADQLYYSDRALHLLGIPPGGPNTRATSQWNGLLRFQPQDLRRHAEAIAEHLAGKTALYDREFRLAGDGSEHWVRIRGVCVRDPSGVPKRMAGSIEDISDRKRTEGERDRLDLQLRQAHKLEAIGTLAGGIAHDFNNILGAILGYGELARTDAETGAHAMLRRHIDGVLTAALRAKSLVERILAFSRSGTAERSPVHVQSVVGEALDLLQPSLPRGVTLRRELCAGDAAVLSDATQIHQVVMNLCTNAMHAMKQGGEISVRLSLVDQAQATPVATGELPPGPYVRLSVQDQGEGIPPEMIGRIFDPFFTTKGMGAGTGLGLSLVHGIVADLGGGIEVVSAPHAGSHFVVYIPWLGHGAAQKEADAPLLLGDGERVLLVDDEASLVQSGEEVIAALGYEPVGFTSSVEALEVFAADPGGFDLILSDETMPELPGSGLAAEVRKLRGDIPIVLMSGYVTSALVTRARAAGVGEVLAKPLVRQDIARCLATMLRKRRGA